MHAYIHTHTHTHTHAHIHTHTHTRIHTHTHTYIHTHTYTHGEGGTQAGALYKRCNHLATTPGHEIWTEARRCPHKLEEPHLVWAWKGLVPPAATAGIFWGCVWRWGPAGVPNETATGPADTRAALSPPNAPWRLALVPPTWMNRGPFSLLQERMRIFWWREPEHPAHQKGKCPTTFLCVCAAVALCS